ncbi:unannotated protein [freshwater metagenome]|uniref:Unannotated protein n=1 Tax=freshwater metagenome TaxID=449393 RepID=A0A6J6D3F2_9ZZZZ
MVRCFEGAQREVAKLRAERGSHGIGQHLRQFLELLLGHSMVCQLEKLLLDLFLEILCSKVKVLEQFVHQISERNSAAKTKIRRWIAPPLSFGLLISEGGDGKVGGFV